MWSFSAILKQFWRLITNPTSDQKAILGDARPFLIMLTALLGIVSVIVIREAPELFSPGRLLLFTPLMVLHLSLHWLSPFAAASKKWRIPHLILQGGLAFCVSLLAQSPALALAAFCALIGETLGMIGTTRLGWIAVIVYLGLMPLSYWLIGGQTMLNNWLSPTISTSIILIVFMVLFNRQVKTSQRAQALAGKLETANRQLAAYAAQVEDLTLAAERQRMARELHDTLAQGVAGLVLQLEAVKAHLASGRGDRGAAIIDQALKRARSTLADSRAAIDDLRSAPSNLLESIREKIERFKQATGIPCELDLSLDENYTIPNGADEHTLRVLSEALVNITRHAQAAQVWVQFAVHDDQLVLEIRDNGQGFDPETATRSGHYGLLGMRERARLAGGTLTIQSHMGRGTHIKLLIPTSSEGTSS